MQNRKMLPAYQRLKDELDQRPQQQQSLFNISFQKFSVITVSLPLFSFIFCVSYSLIFYFEQSTSTHCHTWNYLPSISAAIGQFQPQAIVWQICIIIHFIPRLIITWMYKNYYEKIVRRNRQGLVSLAILLNVIENLTLLGLSLFTSTHNYEIHKNCFCTFIIVSEIYMIISYHLYKNSRRNEELTKLETRSLKLKKYLCIINIISILLASYFFVRHNDHCEGGVYTFFALFEYIVVLTNMGFHMTAAIDFEDKYLVFDWQYGLKVHEN